MADREVKVRISGDASSAVDAFDKAKKSAGDFEKSQASLISSIKGQWLAASAAIATATMAINKAWDMAKVGAAYSEQYGILDNLAQKYKTTADAMIKEMQRASDGQIAKIDLVNTALGGLGKGLNPDQLINLSNAARTLGDIAGEDATTAIQKLTEALETGRTRGIKAFTGNTIDLDEALGDLNKVMSEAEKTQYRYNNLMIHTAELEGQMTKAVDDSADRIDKLNARWKDLMTSMSVGVKSVVIGAIDAFNALVEAQSNVDISGMSGVDTYVAPKANKSAKKIGGTADQNLAVDQLAMLDNVLLKRNLAMRKTEEAAKATEKHTKAVKDHNKAIDETAKLEKAALDAFEERIRREMALDKEKYDNRLKYEDMMHNVYLESLPAAEQAIQKIMDEQKKQFDFLDQMTRGDIDMAQKAADAKLEIEKANAAKIRKIHEDTAEQQKKLAEEAKKTNQENIDNIARGFGILATASKDMASAYADGSKEARVFEEAAKAFEIAQSAAAVASAVVAVANQGGGDPYSAFPRIAAMAATMASFLATIGKSIGGGGSTSGATNTYHSTSRTLGSNEASESAMKSYDLLKDTYQMQYTKLSAINSELRSLNANLTGLATSIAQTGGANQFLTGRPSNKFDFMMREMFAARGIYMPSTSVGDILSGGGVDASGYMKFGRKPEYSELNPLIDKYVDQSMVDMAKLFSTMGGAFGVSNDVIGQYNIPAISMNFKGLSDEEIQQRIIRQFSDIMDTGIEDIFGNAVYTFVKGFQQIDESIGETVTRLMRNREIVSEFMTSTGVALNKTTQEAISFSESLITIAGGLDALTDAFNSFYNNFYSDSEKQINYQRQLTDIVDDFGITTLPANREGWRNLVNSMAGVNDEAYVSFLNASDMAHEYYSYIEDESEKATEAARQARLEQISSEYDLRSSALTEAYNKNLEAAQARLSAITEIVNKLSAARERMKIQDAAIEAMQFRGAKSNLMRGIWTDASLDTLTGINPGMYSTRQDYLRDYYDIYHQLGALEADAMSKKSAAERTVDWLKRQYDLDLQNLELQRTQAEALVAICNQCTGTKISGYAEGGIATGWALVGEKGPELVNFGKSSRVYNNSESRSLMSNSELIAEVKALREEVRAGNTAVAGWTYKTYRTLDKFDYDGLPATRT